MAVVEDEGFFFVGGGDVGPLAAIVSTLALMDDDVLWSGLQEGKGRGFQGDSHGRWLVLWDLMLGPSEAPVLNELTLWDLKEVLLERRRVEFCVNDDDRLRGRMQCGRLL